MSIVFMSTNSRFWYCVYTKAGQEELVCRMLSGQPEIEVFNPLVRRRRYLRGRMEEVIEELFPCYIFARFELSKFYWMIKYTRGVRRLAGDRSGNPYVVEDGLIDLLRSRVKDGYIKIEPPEFTPGERVKIMEGPLKGLTGIFYKGLKPCERVLILLNTLSYQVRVEIDRGLLAKA